MNKSAAPSKANAAAPMAIPAIAPPESPELPVEAATAAVVVAAGAAAADVDVDVAAAVEVGTEDVVLEKGFSSDGHGSPGCNMKVEFLANCVCTDTDSVPFGLITPTMP
jgi:hypothetical protein